MRAFIDTSTLIKKYKKEPGRSVFLKILDQVNVICVSSVTYIELLCSLQRVCEENSIQKKKFMHIKQEVDMDYNYFEKVPLDNVLEKIVFNLRQKYSLKSLDLIQLSSGIVSNPSLFLTSDKQLYAFAKKEFRKVELI